MYIISPFKDYYDTCAVFGIDKSVRYVRKTHIIENFNKPSEEDAELCKAILKTINKAKKKTLYIDAKGSIDCVYVGFCAKIYAGLRMAIDPDTGRVKKNKPFYLGQPANTQPEQYSYAWSAKDVHQEDLAVVREYSGFHFLRSKRERAPSIGDWFEHQKQAGVVEDVDLFTQHGLVCFLLIDNRIIINPNLQDVMFMRLIDGATTFQELAMFISGVLPRPDNPMIELTDKDRIQAHGFDHKTSFRKDGPTGRKARKKARKKARQ